MAQKQDDMFFLDVCFRIFKWQSILGTLLALLGNCFLFHMMCLAQWSVLSKTILPPAHEITPSYFAVSVRTACTAHGPSSLPGFPLPCEPLLNHYHHHHHQEGPQAVWEDLLLLRLLRSSYPLAPWRLVGKQPCPQLRVASNSHAPPGLSWHLADSAQVLGLSKPVLGLPWLWLQ